VTSRRIETNTAATLTTANVNNAYQKASRRVSVDTDWSPVLLKLIR